jgi:hypothetical protein
MKPAPKPQPDIDGPAIITPLHVQDRPATDKDGKAITGSTAWRKLTPLQSVYAKNQLAGGSNRYTAADRYAVGTEYARLFDASECPGRDSTQALNAIRGGGGSPSDARSKAASELACVHSHMGERDRKIIMRVCGEGYWPSEAIREICGDYRDTIMARFREALDALADAMETARRHPRVIDMARRS